MGVPAHLGEVDTEGVVVEIEGACAGGSGEAAAHHDSPDRATRAGFDRGEERHLSVDQPAQLAVAAQHVDHAGAAGQQAHQRPVLHDDADEADQHALGAGMPVTQRLRRLDGAAHLPDQRPDHRQEQLLAPIILIGIVLGLAMDYQVLLVTACARSTSASSPATLTPRRILRARSR